MATREAINEALGSTHTNKEVEMKVPMAMPTPVITEIDIQQ